MGDLERMGRELKCPICLSLLDSAISLTCNHLFCNSCILKSMKSASACPVCKIPFTRREVRPAPHIDNLVTIYKNMEAASGINIFVTQNHLPPTKSSDEEKQCEGDGDSSNKEADGISENHAKGKNTLKRKNSRKNTKTSVKSSGSDTAKPSFPAKKRVQVPQNLLSETPLKNLKLGGSLSEIDGEGTEKASVMANIRPHQTQKDDNLLTPFFWLREEENNDKLSQRSNEDPFIDGPTPIPPSFSDLKDSDDENPSEVAPLDVVQNKVSVDLFDSEMFEWTQRPCSPELFSSPVKMQVEDSVEIDEIQEEMAAASEKLETNKLSAGAGNSLSENHKEGNKLADVLPSGVSSPQIKSSDVLNAIKKSTKRSRKPRGKAMQEQIGEQKISIDGMDVVPNVPLKVARKQASDNKHSRRGKRVCYSTRIDENEEDLAAASEKLETCKLSADAGNSLSENHKEGNKLADVVPPSVSSPQIQSSDVLNGIKKSAKRSRKARGKAMQVEENQEELVAASEKLETNNLSADAGNSLAQNHKEGNKLADMLPPSVSSPQIKSSDVVLSGIKQSTKRSRKARGKAMQEQIGEQQNSIGGVDVDPNMPLKVTMEQSSDNKHKSSNLGKANRRGKRVCFNTSINPTPQTTCTVSNNSGVLSDGELKMSKISRASPSKQENEKHCPQELVGRHHLKRSGKQKLDYVEVLAEDLSSTQSPTNEFAGSDSSLQMNSSEKASNSRQRKNKISRKSSSCSKESRSTKKLKLSSDCISKTKTGKEIEPHESILQGPDAGIMNETSKEKHRPLMDERILRKCESHVKKYQCVFCPLSEESEASGQMVHYFDGKPVPADYEGGSKVIHCHRNCTEWAPNVYFEDDNAINLEAEISRSRRIKCSFCGTKGAALGCYEKSCRRSFHVPCAKWTSQCRWDMENFVMLCPLHASSKLPYESSGSQESSKKCTGEDKSRSCKHDTKSQTQTAHGSYKKITLCCSALSMQEKDVVSEFERATKVTVLKNWDSSVTHIIAAVDENGACRRTLKVLLGILEGKWILNIDWIKACMKEMEPVDEERYEINLDIHGIRDGPRLGRLRVLNKQPKLFDGYKFYFMGDFVPSYKGFLQDIVIAAGGLVLHRKPVLADHPHQTLIIYSLELPNKCKPSEKDTIFSRRRCDAEVLASSTGSKVASNTWILNSIAACKLQCLTQ